MKTAFDIQIRALECQQCGAPVTTETRAAGEVTCTFCGTVNRLTERTRAHRPPPSAADEVARLSRLAAQKSSPISGHAYDLSRPPLGFTGDASMLEPAWLDAEWKRVKARPPGSVEEQRSLIWLAFAVASARIEEAKPAEARAALGSALERVTDPGFQHLVRCRLASEALRAGDLDAAEGWLSECDPAAEVLELDSAYREPLARLHLARRNPSAALGVLGTYAADIPWHSSHEATAARLRLHAMEVSGRDVEPELRQMIALYGEQPTLERLAQEDLAPKARRAFLRAGMMDLAKQRDAVPTGIALLRGPMKRVPFYALVLSVLALIPRCAFDMDPIMGAPGHVVCPKLCDDCHGPWRVFTHWTQTGPGEYSSNGPSYFCPAPSNGIAEMSDDQLGLSMYQLGQYELTLSPFPATFLTFFAFFLLFLPVGVMGARAAAKLKRDALTRRVHDTALDLREPAPDPVPTGGGVGSVFVTFVLSIAVPVLIALALIIADLA